jgi:hypothetical protein
MPSLKELERTIRAIEGFPVVILHRDGRDARGDTKRLRRYPFAGPMRVGTVSDWNRRRFYPYYGDEYEVAVADRRGRGWQPVHGATLVKTVRNWY